MEKPSFEDYMMDDDKTLSDYLHDFMTYLAAQGNDKAAKFDMVLAICRSGWMSMVMVS